MWAPRYHAVMTSVDRLIRVALPRGVSRCVEGDLAGLDIVTPAATGRVFFHGGHLTRWTPSHTGAPVIWTSAHSLFRADKAIRGGVPICFPWFGAHPTDAALPAHGYARLEDWTLDRAETSDDDRVTLAFVLETGPETWAAWPHGCRATCTLTLGAALTLSLRVENTGSTPFTFEEALHTYCGVGDIREVSVTGLEQTDYLDKVAGFSRTRQGDDPIRFTGETDRVYLDTTTTCRIVDPRLSRTIVIAKQQSRNTVVWNPWSQRARAFSDFGDDEWQTMVCVETCNVRDAAIHLAPGATHTMQTEVRVEPHQR